jgi:hypothetical protein
MALELIQAVRSILDRVTEVTGQGIEYVETEDLPVPAMMRMAGEESPNHRLFFKKHHDETVNHVIANECGHILRLYGVPEEKRLIPAASQKTLGRYAGEMEADIRRLYRHYPPEQLMNLLMLWYESILYQLTKMPTDIRVEKWLHENYPDVIPMQLKSLAEQNEKAVATLTVDIRKTMPGRIYDACNIMNYVYFKVLGKAFDLDYVASYRFTLYFARGEELISQMEEIETDSQEGDVLMINTWAKYFHFADWFEWTQPGKVSRQHLQ